MTHKINNQILLVALKIQDLFFAREDRYLFKGLSLDIHEGEWVLLRGANGMGKSTLLKLIAGHILPESGEIWTIPFHFLGHRNGIRPHLTVHQQLCSKRDLLGIDADIDAILVACSLDRVRDFPISHLSAGQQRKVGLAELYFTQEKLWLLDEPLDHLDHKSQETFENLFQRHVQSGGTILQSSHSSAAEGYNTREIWL